MCWCTDPNLMDKGGQEEPATQINVSIAQKHSTECRGIVDSHALNAQAHTSYSPNYLTAGAYTYGASMSTTVVCTQATQHRGLLSSS